MTVIEVYNTKYMNVKAIKAIVISVALVLCAGLHAEGIVYVDASAFPVFGKAIENTSARYERFPASYESVSRPPLWSLSRNSAGLYVRFRSDSKNIRARWTSTLGFGMNHMTDVGVRGLDLYAFHDGEWRFAGCGRPRRGESVTDAPLCSDMDGETREYILYLSLYDGIDKLEIGVDEGSLIEAPVLAFPNDGKKIVMYGTSILQGGCANRPGMAFTSIIGRRLGNEVINLGFSGNARLDHEVAELMAKVENPGVFVLDYVPNCEADLIDREGEGFFRILRDACPDVPVIFVENPLSPDMVFNMTRRESVESRNMAQRNLYLKLKKSGERRLFYVSADELIGDDGEATVDGDHFTDLGMMRYSHALVPVIRKALRWR